MRVTKVSSRKWRSSCSAYSRERMCSQGLTHTHTHTYKTCQTRTPVLTYLLQCEIESVIRKQGVHEAPGVADEAVHIWVDVLLAELWPPIG